MRSLVGVLLCAPLVGPPTLLAAVPSEGWVGNVSLSVRITEVQGDERTETLIRSRYNDVAATGPADASGSTVYGSGNFAHERRDTVSGPCGSAIYPTLRTVTWAGQGATGIPGFRLTYRAASQDGLPAGYYIEPIAKSGTSENFNHCNLATPSGYFQAPVTGGAPPYLSARDHLVDGDADVGRYRIQGSRTYTLASPPPSGVGGFPSSVVAYEYTLLYDLTRPALVPPPPTSTAPTGGGAAQGATAATLVLDPPETVARSATDPAGVFRWSGTANGVAEVTIKARPTGGPACAASPEADRGTLIASRGVAAGSFQGSTRATFTASGPYILCGWVTRDGAVLAAATDTFRVVDQPVRIAVTVTPAVRLRQGVRVNVTGRITSAYGTPGGECRVEQRVGGRWRIERARFLIPGRPCTANVMLATAGNVRLRVRYLGPLGSYRGVRDLDSNWAPGVGQSRVLKVARGTSADLARVRVDARRPRVVAPGFPAGHSGAAGNKP